VRVEKSGAYSFSTNYQPGARLKVRSGFKGSPEYDLELAPEADQLLIVATCVVIARIRRQDVHTQ
jgi:uncharacterized protein YxjI